jgi:hypothetical protein
MAFIDLGDQFINLSENRDRHRDQARHFGLVVDDKEKVRRRLEEAGVETLPGRGVEFRDPWGNRVQIADHALRVSHRATRIGQSSPCQTRRSSPLLT